MAQWRPGYASGHDADIPEEPRRLDHDPRRRGTARIGGVAVNEIQQWEFDTRDPDDERIRENSYLPGSVYGFGNALYYENVIDVLRGRCEPDTDGREGLRSLELLTAMYLSARDGRRVTLPLEH